MDETPKEAGFEDFPDSRKVAALLGASGKLMDAAHDYALAYINALVPEELPTDGDKAIEALKIYFKGLQDPESDLFVDSK